MVDTATAHDMAWEEALEEAINRFEQGEVLTEAQFDELVAELERRHAEMAGEPEGNPRHTVMETLRARAARLEASAADGKGPTDQISRILATMTGSDTKPAPSLVEHEPAQEE
ncbi:hypothetical protein GCM10009093_10990 [Brevundimonas terrae]|uniref:Uncharacterized protein n=1 Tax=Brevundimonas terrae TaxID=363631 RepID=A0ABP3HZP4_9CAUL|nr:hypothetical protein [Brevundimonas terrae]NIJ25344.1 hypothetical protein [Brevundimonas terrae]